MGLTVAELMADLGLDTGPFDRKLGGIGGSLNTSLGAAMGGAKSLMAGQFGAAAAALAPIALAAGAAAGAALLAGAVKGVVEFAQFEEKMNEVFTLLPGISEQAMGAMEDDVKSFSREFGVLPDKVVPALYQSLSAGVPRDNVFEFLETAQKAAKGGVTELATAVDGISSVVNAYGSDVLGATDASDLMFTAVRLGKTTFEELSASLFNVVPTASSAGVAFGDVTAALASMTAQGTPTSVATTQLRQLFVELTKDGSAAGAMFEKVAGRSFKEFIAKGGDTGEALALLDEHARKNGKSIADMFGSVEAGSAALALTGKGAEGFRNNLAAMADSAGATDAAFQQMEQGIMPVWNRIKANVAVGLINVGDFFAPAVEAGFNALLDAFAALDAAVHSSQAQTFFRGLGEVWSWLKAIGAEVWPYVRTIIAEAILTAQSILEGFRPTIEWLGETWRKHGDDVKAALGIVKNVISTVLKVVFSIIRAVMAAIRGDWKAAWNHIKSAAKTAWEGIKAAARAGLSGLRSIVSGLAGKVRGWIGDLAGALKQKGRDLIQGLINGVAEKLAALRAKIAEVADAVKRVFSLGIESNSPSRVFRRYGNYMMEGLALGIADAARLPNDALSQLAGGFGTPALAGGYAGGRVINATFNVTMNGSGLSQRQAESAVRAGTDPGLQRLAREIMAR